MPKHQKKQQTPPNRGVWRLFLQDGSASAGVPFWLLVSPLLAFVAIISFCHTGSTDLWWHMKTGEWIWAHHSIPRSDPFSYTAAGQPWITHEWLFGLFSFLVYRAAGLAGLIGAKALLVAGLFALTARAAQVRGAMAGMTVTVLAACYAVARLRFAERPEMLSLPIAVAFLLVYDLSRERPRLLLSLPALQLLWVNLHGGTALLGWFLVGAFLLDQAWQLRRPVSPWPRFLFRKELSWHLGAFAGVIAVSFANPNTFQALSYGLLRAKSSLSIKEFESLGTRLGLGADLAITIFIAYAVLVAGLFVLRFRSVRMYEWLLFPLLLALAVTFFRFRSLFVFLLAPSLAWHLSQEKRLRRIRWWLPALASAALLLHVVSIERDSYTYRFGAGAHPGILPVEAAEFIKESGLSGRMFNCYDFGGYLIWSLGPRHPVFIDGREDVYVQPGIVDEYLNCFRSREQWQKLVASYGIDFAVVDYPVQPPSAPEMSLDRLAFPRSGWALIYFDEMAVIYARRNSSNDEIIRQKEIRTVQPLQLSSYLDSIIAEPTVEKQFLEEITANQRDHPSSFRARFLMGIFALKRGPAFLAEAVREFQQSIALNPEYIPAYINLGSVYMHLGRYSEARQLYERVLAREKNATAEEQLEILRRMR
jgi:hypothetical protein